MVIDVVRLTPAKLAVMAADELEVTVKVVIVKVADVEPFGIVTDLGTPAFVELDARFTVTPVPPAGADSVTVPIDVLPPVTVEGEAVTELSPGACSVKVAPFWLEPITA